MLLIFLLFTMYSTIIEKQWKSTQEKYARFLRRYFANSSLLMGMEKNCLIDLHKVMKLGMQMNYYPPCSNPDLVLGLGPHSDSGSITLILQDDELPGLQIKHKGEWIPVTPIPGAFVGNLGDTMEAWSNGMYKSVEHRAVTNAIKARMSIAMFVMPDEEAEIGPVETMVLDRPVLYKRIEYIDFLRRYLERKLDGKASDIIRLQGQ